ncbi:exported hypothetical protein [Hyphomicrobiales bacterium]|nr:exported hypothetical protein [Hyphomicrobiales bacterium]CAH1673395.1 exported hypothetical protein [Hyphomicrobiales bacterium]
MRRYRWRGSCATLSAMTFTLAKTVVQRMAVSGVTTVPEAVGPAPNNAKSSGEEFARVDFFSKPMMFLSRLIIETLRTYPAQDREEFSTLKVKSARK